MESSFHLKKVLAAALSTLLVIAALAYGGYRYWKLQEDNAVLSASSTELQKEIAGLEQSLGSARGDLSAAQNENKDLALSLQAEQSKNNVFEGEINQISGTVDTLQKLSATDPQLLEKYSKVYFLNDNYVPASLSAIDPRYLFDKNRPELILSGVLPDIEAMLTTATRAGVSLQIISAYRSFYEQASLKVGYKVTYGAGTANQFSAEQGYSEHQLGTAVDFATPEVKDTFLKFATSTAYQWLTGNAYRFGFIPSYPRGNTYYQFEPWHWRFVGIALATRLHDNNEYFYNLSQREIDTYLVSFFD